MHTGDTESQSQQTHLAGSLSYIKQKRKCRWKYSVAENQKEVHEKILLIDHL